MRYTIYNPDTLEVLYVTQDLDESPKEIILEQEIIDDEGNIITPAVTTIIEFVRPENSLLYDGCDFVKPIVNQHPNPSHLIEGATAEDIATLRVPIYMEKIQETVIDLVKRAERAAIEKTGSNDYITVQIDLYRNKYRVALGEIQSPAIELYLRGEADEFGLSYEDFCALIISKYESSIALFENFKYMIERCRTKIQTLVENGFYTKADEAFSIVQTLSDAAQADGIMSEILAL